MYDLIGDIHGYAGALQNLLHKLGYAELQGVWQHPERRVIFLGDFVDRGPQQLETVRIARRMIEAGHAQAVMGNHEFNAVAWATPHPDQPGEHLRPHSAKNRQQHRAFLEQVGEGSPDHGAIIDWFKTLPLFIELDGLRVIHACWHPQHLKTLERYTDAGNRVLPEAWPALTRVAHEAYDALETVLKGLELALPHGCEYADKDGHIRKHVRTQWWSDGLTYRDLAMAPPEVIASIPHTPVPDDLLPGYDGHKPLFVGHYWLTGQPAPLSPQIACLDYSIASGKAGGKLCAYRWQGEQELAAEHFVWVSE